MGAVGQSSGSKRIYKRREEEEEDGGEEGAGMGACARQQRRALRGVEESACERHGPAQRNARYTRTQVAARFGAASMEPGHPLMHGMPSRIVRVAATGRMQLSQRARTEAVRDGCALRARQGVCRARAACGGGEVCGLTPVRHRVDKREGRGSGIGSGQQRAPNRARTARKRHSLHHRDSSKSRAARERSSHSTPGSSP